VHCAVRKHGKLLRSLCIPAHLLAGFSTGAAGCCASLHLLVLTHAFAAFGARGADLRADATGLHVEVRLPEHEIRATAAAFGAID